MTLEEKSIAHDQNWIPRMSGDHLSPEMLALNPRGKLPILEWADGVTLYESMAICRFLELEQPEPALVPAATADRARVLVRSQEADTYLLDATFKPLEMGLMRKPDQPVTDEQRAANRAMFDELDRWEGYLATDDLRFIAADQFSLADVAVFPLVAFGVRCKLDLARRTPRLAAWYQRLADRPSVQASWPPHWRDSDGGDIGLNEV